MSIFARQIRQGTNPTGVLREVPDSRLKPAEAGCIEPSLDGFRYKPGDSSPGGWHGDAHFGEESVARK